MADHEIAVIGVPGGPGGGMRVVSKYAFDQKRSGASIDAPDGSL